MDRTNIRPTIWRGFEKAFVHWRQCMNDSGVLLKVYLKLLLNIEPFEFKYFFEHLEPIIF